MLPEKLWGDACDAGETQPQLCASLSGFLAPGHSHLLSVAPPQPWLKANGQGPSPAGRPTHCSCRYLPDGRGCGAVGGEAGAAGPPAHLWTDHMGRRPGARAILVWELKGSENR